MKWWYWLIIIIGVLLIFGIYYNATHEGFQTISNVEYKFKEVFLVAATIVSDRGNPVPIYTVPTRWQYENQGYTWAEAEKICRGYGGDLATLSEVQKAYDNSGNWCPLGWTKDSNTTAYYLPTLAYPCQLSTIPPAVPGLSAITDLSGVRRAFAICNSPKPPPTPLVVDFNKSRYSMISSEFLNKIMVGITGDMFPIQFTPAQAYFAIDVSGIDTTNNHFSFTKARNRLIQKYETIDADILAAMNQPDNPAAWSTLSGANTQSCALVQEKDRDVSDKVLMLQRHFRDVSGNVRAAMKSKAENANIQAMLLEVCSNTNPTDSPACSKLATLDFDLFYTNPRQDTLADLETLNAQLYSRREEVCAILHNVRNIKSALGCPYNIVELGLAPECSVGCSTDPGVYDCSNAAIFDINAVGGLKYSLEQLSPLFDKSEYNTILTSVIGQLSYVVDAPSLATFDESYKNMRLINNTIRDIQALISDY
jgi:hypothetical protein